MNYKSVSEISWKTILELSTLNIFSIWGFLMKYFSLIPCLIMMMITLFKSIKGIQQSRINESVARFMCSCYWVFLKNENGEN